MGATIAGFKEVNRLFNRFYWVGVDSLFRFSPLVVLAYTFFFLNDSPSQIIAANGLVIILRTSSVFLRFRSRLPNILKVSKSCFLSHSLANLLRNLVLGLFFCGCLQIFLGAQYSVPASIIFLSTIEDFIVFSIQRRNFPKFLAVLAVLIVFTDLLVLHLLLSNDFDIDLYIVRLTSAFSSFLLACIVLLAFLAYNSSKRFLKKYLKLVFVNFGRELLAGLLAASLLVRGQLIPVTLEGIVPEKEYVFYASLMQVLQPLTFLYRSYLNTYQMKLSYNWRNRKKGHDFCKMYVKNNIIAISLVVCTFVGFCFLHGILFSSYASVVYVALSLSLWASLVYLVFNDFLVLDKKIGQLSVIGVISLIVFIIIMLFARNGIISWSVTIVLASSTILPLGVFPLVYSVKNLSKGVLNE